MLAKYSSTRDMLDADGDTTMSLHSQASATSQRPELGHTGTRRPSWSDPWEMHEMPGYQLPSLGGYEVEEREKMLL